MGPASYYLKYGRLVDEKLRSGILETASRLYAALRTIVISGDEKIEEIASFSAVLRNEFRLCFRGSGTSRDCWV